MRYENIVQTYISEAQRLPQARNVVDVLDRIRRLHWWLNQARAFEMLPGFPHTASERDAFLALSDWLIGHAKPSHLEETSPLVASR